MGAASRKREASRRHFLRTMLGLGLSGSLLADLLATAAPAAAPPRTPGCGPSPRQARGRAAPAVLAGAHDPERPSRHRHKGQREASRVVYEPLFSVNPEAEFIPILVAEIPAWRTAVVLDGTWTIWRLKQG